MPKLARSDELKVNQCQNKSKVQEIRFLILNVDIDLTFACLREAASAKAGILKFGFGQLTWTLFLHKPNPILS
jgi:hypothetical protein